MYIYLYIYIFIHVYIYTCAQIAYLTAPSMKLRLREKMTRSIIMGDAAYFACCIDDVAEVLFRGMPLSPISIT